MTEKLRLFRLVTDDGLKQGSDCISVRIADFDEILKLIDQLIFERNPLYTYVEQIDAGEDPLSKCTEYSEGMPCDVCGDPEES